MRGEKLSSRAKATRSAILVGGGVIMCVGLATALVANGRPLNGDAIFALVVVVGVIVLLIGASIFGLYRDWGPPRRRTSTGSAGSSWRSGSAGTIASTSGRFS